MPQYEVLQLRLLVLLLGEILLHNRKLISQSLDFQVDCVQGTLLVSLGTVCRFVVVLLTRTFPSAALLFLVQRNRVGLASNFCH